METITTSTGPESWKVFHVKVVERCVAENRLSIKLAPFYETYYGLMRCRYIDTIRLHLHSISWLVFNRHSGTQENFLPVNKHLLFHQMH